MWRLDSEGQIPNHSPSHQLLLLSSRWGRDRTGTNKAGQCHGSPPNLLPVTLTCVKPPVICVINKKLIIRTIVTISAQGHVIAPVTNDTQIREAQVIKLCTGTIGAGTQVEVPLEILWTKLARTIAAAAVGEASLPCSDKALSQVRAFLCRVKNPMGGALCTLNPPQSCASLVLSLPSFLNRLLPVLEGHSRGLHLSHLNPRSVSTRNFCHYDKLLYYITNMQFMWVNNHRILMSRWVEPAERLLLFLGRYFPWNLWKLKRRSILEKLDLGKYQRHAVESRRGSKLILQFRRGKSRFGTAVARQPDILINHYF